MHHVYGELFPPSFLHLKNSADGGGRCFMRACFLSFSLILSAWLLLMSVRFLLLVHMGAELCKVNNQKSLSLSARTLLTPNFSPKHFPPQLCQEHMDLKKSCMEAHWRETTCCLKSEVEPLRREFAGTLLNLSTSERQPWRRRKMLRG